MSAKDERRLELLSRMLAVAGKLAEAGKCVAREDAVQASEKLYKAAEEAVKELAFRFKLSKSKEARRKGRWTATLLFRAVRRLSERVERVNLEILNWWAQAWFLHVEGFHEARLEIEEVKVRVGSVRELVSVVEK